MDTKLVLEFHNIIQKKETGEAVDSESLEFGELSVFNLKE